MTVYIKHIKSGTVQSLTDEMYNSSSSHVSEVSKMDGQRYPIAGITLIDEAEAREINPQLFGAWDPQVVFTASELVAQHEYQTKLAEFQKAHETNRRKV